MNASIITLENKENAHRYKSQITPAKRRVQAMEIAEVLITKKKWRRIYEHRIKTMDKKGQRHFKKIYAITLTEVIFSDRIPSPYTEQDAIWWLTMVEEHEGKDGIFRAIEVDGKIVGNISVEQDSDVYKKMQQLAISYLAIYGERHHERGCQ